MHTFVHNTVLALPVAGPQGPCFTKRYRYRVMGEAPWGHATLLSYRNHLYLETLKSKTKDWSLLRRLFRQKQTSIM